MCSDDEGENRTAVWFARSLQHVVDGAVLHPAAWSVCSTFEPACVAGVLITFVVYHEYLLIFWHAEKLLISLQYITLK